MSNSNVKYAVPAFIISPFFAVVLFAKQYKSRIFLNIIWVFFVFLGYILVTNNESGDSYRYSRMFKEYSGLSLENQLNYFSEDAKLDLFRPISFKLVSLVSTNPKFYFAFVAFFFGFFYSRILGVLFENINQNLNWFLTLIIINYLFLLNFYGFQFVRFNTATVVFIYFLLRYYLENKQKKFLVLATLSVFIHFTYVFPVVFLFIFQFIPRFTRLFFYGFLVTSLLTVIEFDTLANIIENYLPQELESRKGYLDTEYREKVTEDSMAANWYIKLRPLILKNTFILLLFLSYSTFRKKIMFNPKYEELISFLLFFGVAANIVAIVPSGSRFLSIVYGTMWLLLITILVNNYKVFFKNIILKRYLSFVFLFNFIIGFRYIIDVFPIEFFLGNIITAAIAVTDVEMIVLVKSLF